MPGKDESKETQVVMVRAVARRWIRKMAKAEYRVRVFYGSRGYQNLPNLLRSFRDGKTSITGVDRIEDLGVDPCGGGEFLEVWSHDRRGMLKLGKWLEDKGFDTTGVW